MVAPWNRKAQQWNEGRVLLFKRMQAKIKATDKVIWFHVASLGEFEQGRPIIEKVRQDKPEYKILVTFFSPSGYEIRKNYQGADFIFYLPVDRPKYVKKFLDIAHPEVAIFVKYEYWINFLSELKSRKVRTFIVSAIFRRNSVFFRFYGDMWRNALTTFETIFVQDLGSKQLLSTIGFDNVVVAGDTRFDRVAQIASNAKKIDTITNFAGESRVFVAGSTWEPDEDILIPLINANPDIKFIIAPHEMEERRIERILNETDLKAIRYTKVDNQDISDCQVLVLDTVGILSSVYGYATWAYIGGGFGVGIHNTLEAATFGLPIAFGPNYLKFKEACDLVRLEAARSVNSKEELEEWFNALNSDEKLLEKASLTSRSYTTKNQGATSIICSTLFS